MVSGCFVGWHIKNNDGMFYHAVWDGRLGASTGQKYLSTSTSTWKNDEYKYKYKYWIFRSTWVQVRVLLKVIEYKYRVLWL